MFVEVNGMQENKAGEGDSEVEALNREVRGGLSEKVASEQRQEVREEGREGGTIRRDPEGAVTSGFWGSVNGRSWGQRGRARGSFPPHSSSRLGGAIPQVSGRVSGCWDEST